MLASSSPLNYSSCHTQWAGRACGQDGQSGASWVAEQQEGFIILSGAPPVLDISFWDRAFSGGLGCQNNPPPALYTPPAPQAPSVCPFPYASLKFLEALLSFSQISTVSPPEGLGFWGSCPVVLPPQSCRHFWSGLARSCTLHGLPTKGGLNRTLLEGDNRSRSPGLAAFCPIITLSAANLGSTPLSNPCTCHWS